MINPRKVGLLEKWEKADKKESQSEGHVIEVENNFTNRETEIMNWIANELNEAQRNNKVNTERSYMN